MEFFSDSYSEFDNKFTNLECSGLILMIVVDDSEGNSFASFAVVVVVVVVVLSFY